jgi:hypothetical protein
MSEVLLYRERGGLAVDNGERVVFEPHSLLEIYPLKSSAQETTHYSRILTT